MPPSYGEYADEKAVVEHVEKLEAAESQVDPAAEKRLLRKLDFIILPQVTLLFLLNFIDRAAVGNAQVAGFSKDLQLRPAPHYDYNVALMVFYIFYIIGEIPSNLILKKVGSWWLALLCFAFGVITVGSAFIKDFGQFLGVRVLLGIAEGGVIPGIAYVMTTYYRRHELAFRIGVFLSLGPGLSGAFGGLLAAGFLNAHIGSLHTWQKIFAMEGTITAAFGILFFFTLPASPEKTRYLTEEERKIALDRLHAEHLGQTHEQTTPRAVFKAICNPFTWLCTLGVVVQGTSLFLPTIIAGLGKYTTTETQLRTVPPYIVSAVWAVFVSYFAWRTKRHGIYIAGSCVLSIVGYIMFIAVKDKPSVLYGASFLTFTGALPCGPFFLAWATANSGSPVARAVTAAIVPAWGSIGSMICTWIYLPKYAPRYIPGHSFNLFCAAGAASIALLLMFYCQRENRQREAGRRDSRLDGKSEEEIKALGHRHPNYRLMV
ncbi:hypothetical protein JCM10213_000387 [Rhodosporidiobolus nylandii]